MLQITAVTLVILQPLGVIPWIQTLNGKYATFHRVMGQVLISIYYAIFVLDLTMT